MKKDNEVSRDHAHTASAVTSGQSHTLPGDIRRDISSETVCGFRVAAYRETHPEHGDKYGHRYSSHWSTPSKNPAVTVERLFTEAQLRTALGVDHAREKAELLEALKRIVEHNGYEIPIALINLAEAAIAKAESR